MKFDLDFLIDKRDFLIEQIPETKVTHDHELQFLIKEDKVYHSNN